MNEEEFEIKKDEIILMLENAYRDLQKSIAHLKVAIMMLEGAKKDLQEATMLRDKTMRKILLDNFSYFVTPVDNVIYNEQTSKILIYQTEDTTGHEPRVKTD